MKRYVMILAVGFLVAGCASAASETTSTESPVPSRLTCPTNETVSTAGGFLAEMLDGFDSREDAVAAWLDDGIVTDASGFVIAKDGESAWIVRSDGTATARVDFLIKDGFTVHGYEACHAG